MSISHSARVSTGSGISATDMLGDLLQLVDVEIPDIAAVTKRLNELALVISSEGVILREEMLAAGAYNVVSRAWLACCFSGAMDVPSPTPGADECRDAVLRILYALTPGNPEIMDDIGWQIMSQALEKTNPEETHILALQLLRNVSIKCEENRENFTWNLGLVEPLVSLISKSNASSQLVSEWCSSMKALLLSDDVRFVYNRAPERKRVIARTRVLPLLAGYLNEKQIQDNEGALNSVVVVLGTMASNEDMCLHIEGGNVLPGISSIFKSHAKNKTLIRNTIALLRYLCVNSGIRERCSAYTFLKWVIDCITFYKKEKDVIDVAVSCCAMMTLGNACQVSQLMNKNGIELLYEVMNENDSDITILKGALFTLRNVIENANSEVHTQIRDMYTDMLRQFAVNIPEIKDYYVLPLMRLLDLKEVTTPDEEDEEEEMEIDIPVHQTIQDLLGSAFDEYHAIGG